MKDNETPSQAARPRSERRVVKRQPLIIGWREIVSLPDLGLEEFRAKIDTGARTTALHATNIATYEKNGLPWVRFHPPRLGHAAPPVCHARISDRREVRNTSGVSEERIIVRTHLHIENRNFLIDISLADRGQMAYPMIIGRTAIRYHRLLVDCGRSWLTRPRPIKPKGQETP